MTGRSEETLREALRQTAASAPPLAVPADLFAHARRVYRWRQVAALAATMAVVALLVFGAYPRLDRDRVQPAQPGPSALPTRLGDAPRWTAQLPDAPVGQAVAVFAGQTSDEGLRGEHFPLTVVGADDQYRIYQRPEWTTASFYAPTFLLSPDGRYLLMAHWLGDAPEDQRTRLLDLRTGTTRELTGGTPLAWSPDGSRAILVSTEFGVSGRGLATVTVVTMPDGRADRSVLLSDPIRPDWVTAALSPDNSSLAVQVGDSVRLFRGTQVVWQNSVPDSFLAGPAAFTPDGNVVQLALTGALTVLDGATGQPLTGPAYPALPRMRTDVPPQARLVGWRAGVPIVVYGSQLLLMTDPITVLLRGADDTGELQIATDLVNQPTREPGPPRPGPFVQRYRTPLLAALVGLAGLALLLAMVRLAGAARRRLTAWLDTGGGVRRQARSRPDEEYRG